MTSTKCHALLGLLGLLGLALTAACNGETSDPQRVYGGARPVTLQVPAQLDDRRDYPLVLILHGYGANGFVQQAYLGLGPLSTRGDAFVLAPDGTVDGDGKQFWNADATCCDFEGRNPDDVGYLSGLVEDVMKTWPIDPGAVFSVGHSNGGFMSYRLACERPELFAAILSLAGNAVSGVPCQPSRPVSVLHVHGTADDVVPYDGAAPSVGTWAGLDGCSGARAPGANLDLELDLAGPETKTEVTGGCPAGVAVDLWTIQDGGHIPALSSNFATSAWEWLVGRRRRP